MGKAEAYVEDYLRDEAKKNDILCYKFTAPGIRGVPDDLLIGNNKVVFVETKSENGTLSAIQEKRIKEMKKHGATVFVCYTREEVDRVIRFLCQK